jgi:hypothetical protein
MALKKGESVNDKTSYLILKVGVAILDHNWIMIKQRVLETEMRN